MVDKMNAKDFTSLGELFSQTKVFCRGLCVVAGMIVRNDDGGAAVSDSAGVNLPGVDKCAVEDAERHEMERFDGITCGQVKDPEVFAVPVFGFFGLENGAEDVEDDLWRSNGIFRLL